MRAMETTPAASLNEGEDVALVRRAPWEINQAPILITSKLVPSATRSLLDLSLQYFLQLWTEPLIE
jgi:hypothetical protein